MVRRRGTGEKVGENSVEAELRAEIAVWRGRAERVRGECDQLRAENARVVGDNARMASALVDLASQVALRPAQTPPPAPQVQDVASALVPLLAELRKAVQPDVYITDKPDASDEQRRGINWQDQGLDNTGGTPDTTRGPFDDEPITIPDYVLDVESLTPDKVKGTRGGWYNP